MGRERRPHALRRRQLLAPAEGRGDQAHAQGLMAVDQERQSLLHTRRIEASAHPQDARHREGHAAALRQALDPQGSGLSR